MDLVVSKFCCNYSLFYIRYEVSGEIYCPPSVFVLRNGGWIIRCSSVTVRLCRWSTLANICLWACCYTFLPFLLVRCSTVMKNAFPFRGSRRCGPNPCVLCVWRYHFYQTSKASTECSEVAEPFLWSWLHNAIRVYQMWLLEITMDCQNTAYSTKYSRIRPFRRTKNSRWSTKSWRTIPNTPWPTGPARLFFPV